MSRFRTLPPAGTRIRAHEFARWLGRSLRPTSELSRLEGALSERYGSGDIFLFSSGRALMTLLLESIRDEARDSGDASFRGEDGPPEVLVPGYTCYSVAASAVRAGFRIRPIDIDPDSLDYRKDALEATDTRRALAIISANLFGIPNDLEYLERFARERSLVLIDDAAQSLGASVGGRPAGSFGDAGLLSLDKGKNITTIQGGILVSRNAGLSERLSARTAEAPVQRWHRSMLQMVQLVAYGVLLHPRLYWLPDRALSLGGTAWDPPTPMTRYSGRLAPMASLLLDRSRRDLVGPQVQTPDDTRRPSGGIPVLRRPVPIPWWWSRSPSPGESVYLRYPVVLRDPDLRTALLEKLRAEGTRHHLLRIRSPSATSRRLDPTWP
jgi:perosamine synthetase